MLACLVGLIVTATVVEVGWLMLEHVGRSAAVRRALETGVVLRVARAVHETQRERGLIHCINQIVAARLWRTRLTG